MLVARRGPGVACGNDGRIYAVGGFPGAGRPTAEAYDHGEDRWQHVAPMNSTAYNDMAAAAGADGRIYAMALSAGSGPNVFEAYDIDLDQWTTLSPAPGQYDFVQLVALADGHLLALGTRGTSDVEMYDPRHDRWSKLGRMPRPRWLFAVTVDAHGRVFVIGGTSGTGPVSAVDAYDPAADRWASASRMPVPRSSMAAATGLDGTIFVFGGYAGRFGEERLIDQVDAFSA